MVTGITERNKLKQELGDEIGSAVHNVPGNPDYVQKKAKIGLFVWEPSDSCKCQWCNERSAEASAPEIFKVSCDLCTFEAESTVRQAALNKMKGHINKLHN